MKRESRFSRSAVRARLALMLAASSLLLSACVNPGVNDPARIGPFFAPTNQTGEAQLPATLRRVVLLPIAAGNIATAETAIALQPVFLTELQKRNRFEVVMLTREECLQRFRVAELSSSAALPADFVGLLEREYAADGVLFIDLTVYQPYRPLGIGIRAKLATVSPDVRLLWTFDNVFSASDPTVANAARNHFLEADRRGNPADYTQGVLQSPTRFATYVAATMFRTLPPVYAPPAKPRK